jgi:hypothetical protein
MMRLLIAAAAVWLVLGATMDVAATAAMVRLVMAVPCLAAEAFSGDARAPWEMVMDALRGVSCSQALNHPQ